MTSSIKVTPNMFPITLFLTVFACAPFVISEEYVIPENLDIDEVLKNDRLLKNYVDCVLERGKCTPEGEQLKKGIPEALQNECAKCNEKHKESIKKVLHHLIEKKPELWKELEEKFDPKGDYRKKYKDLIEKEGLKI